MRDNANKENVELFDRLTLAFTKKNILKRD
jgi:hypothetical protein